MSLSVSFNPASISDDERSILLNMLQPASVTRVFEGTASTFLKTQVTNPQLAEADNPSTGATTAAEAFGLTTPVVETTAAIAFAAPVTDTVTAPATQPDGVEIDNEGLPYDARIHSSSREKIKNGTWKLKRGVDEALVASVKAELRGAMGAPAWPFTPPAAAVPAVPAVPTAPPANAMTFADLAMIVAGAVNAGKITEVKVHEIVNQAGLAGFHLLPTRPDLMPHVAASIQAAING